MPAVIILGSLWTESGADVVSSAALAQANCGLANCAGGGDKCGFRAVTLDEAATLNATIL